MRKAGILAVLVAVSIAIAGCETSQSRPSTSGVAGKHKAWAEAHDKVPLWPLFEQRAQRIGTEMGRRAAALCLASTRSESSDDCFHRQMLVAFDVDGMIGNQCPPGEDLHEDLDCIALAAFTYGLAIEAGGDALIKFDWSDPEASAMTAMLQIVAAQVDKCLSNGSASDARDCVTAGISEGLGLSKEDVQLCQAVEDDQRFGECVGQAYGSKVLVDALARLEAYGV